MTRGVVGEVGGWGRDAVAFKRCCKSSLGCDGDSTSRLAESEDGRTETDDRRGDFFLNIGIREVARGGRSVGSVDLGL